MKLTKDEITVLRYLELRKDLDYFLEVYHNLERKKLVKWSHQWELLPEGEKALEKLGGGEE